MKSLQSPSLSRFLSDFTLGFSDGLTVPFAVTAGLSSLGRTNTVISGGLAELCAGSISMGIGGYLAARDEDPQGDQRLERCDEQEYRRILDDEECIEEKCPKSANDIIRQHLEPLELSSTAISAVMAALSHQPGNLRRAALRVQSYNNTSEESTESQPSSPVASGLSISLGYTVGGIIPLFPYFFASTVGTGLQWSICLCLVALFAFGSGKSWILNGSETLSWGRCTWEGLQMLVLGTLAAGASIMCVKLVENK